MDTTIYLGCFVALAARSSGSKSHCVERATKAETKSSCNAACQKSNWSKHKVVCKSLVDRYVTTLNRFTIKPANKESMQQILGANREAISKYRVKYK